MSKINLGDLDKYEEESSIQKFKKKKKSDKPKDKKKVKKDWEK